MCSFSIAPQHLSAFPLSWTYTPSVARSGLDDEKLSMLAKWAGGLRRDDRPEVAAAGRAIEMLIDEVERLNVLLWDGPLDVVPTAEPEPETVPELQRTLGQRIRDSLRQSEPTIG